jgi:hypothetical protein
MLESSRGTGGVLTPEEMARAQRLQDENATLHESNTLLRSENGRMRREVEELRKGLTGLQQEREPLLRQIRCAEEGMRAWGWCRLLESMRWWLGWGSRLWGGWRGHSATGRCLRQLCCTLHAQHAAWPASHVPAVLAPLHLPRQHIPVFMSHTPPPPLPGCTQ